MKRNFLRLCLIMTVLLSLYSCIHDEVYSSSNPSSTRYTNKSLWKQDEKYIQNVMKVYLENENSIKKINGTPFWDYATTVNTFDEHFLMVPIIDKEKVVAVLQVPRKGSNILFLYSRNNEQIGFFQGSGFCQTQKVTACR